MPIYSVWPVSLLQTKTARQSSKSSSSSLSIKFCQRHTCLSITMKEGIALMNRLSHACLFRASLFALLLPAAPALHADAKWIQPTPEELSMTSQPEVPGATAIYLNREETTDDKIHFFSIYKRIKILSEGGKQYANVEVEYPTGESGFSVDNIEGRTIHADGTVIPFSGKPYDKLIEKTQTVKYMAKVFSMPDVQIGSIIEYRYKLHLDDNRFLSPSWYIQSDLFTRKAHYQWKPTSKQLVSNDDRGQLTSSIAWVPILPKGTELKQSRIPGGSMQDGQLIFDLDVSNIPPAPEEEYMPPIKSFTYRVLFYYSPYHDFAEFWKSEAKYWSKRQNKFIGPGSSVTAGVKELIAPGDTDDQKLHKIYDAVMKLENTDYTRLHSSAEDKSQGLKDVHNTDDVWTRKRGSGDQLADLFVAMARAAGFKAYAMVVTNRDRSIFLKEFPSTSQLDDDIAIVNVGGKETYFDPGTRYCEYGHLAWKHDMSGGMRQTEGGAEIAGTPGESYPFSHTSRLADLNMDEHGVVSGTVTMDYRGSPALRWRQRALTGDMTSLQRELHDNMERMLPAGMDIKLDHIENVDNYSKSLKVAYTVKGPIGSATGKRLLLPGDIFMANAKAIFPHEKRETSVYFDYASFTQDAMRITFPSGFALESMPAQADIPFQKTAIYKISGQTTPTSVTVRRDYAMGDIVVPAEQYKDLREFYSKFETKDQENVILKLSAAPAASASGGN
jgi:Domain of Unknown Function with PDB structure (DUF3857)/Transglutaminase-like superfamily